MSGIVAAAQSSGCCCRPVEGCTCSDPNRPGAVADRQITAIAVSGEITVDHAIRQNASPSLSCECPCSPVGIGYGTGAVRYGYRSPGSVVDPDGLVPEDPCYPGCVNAGCGGCPTFNVSATVGTIICPQGSPGIAGWSSSVRTFGDNFIGQWSWQGRRVGWCVSSQDVRVRSCCRFVNTTEATSTDVTFPTEVDLCGAFIDPTTGQYVNTPYGETLGRLHMIQYASTLTLVACTYGVRIGVTWAFTWEILKALAEGGMWPNFSSPARAGYYADYAKPCLAPTDTVLGTYEIGDIPDYSRRFDDQECGPIRYFDDLRVDFPRFIEVS
jgi:hypothetical protein